MPRLVSITISTYNIENYLRDSLDCVINQTLQDIEIICIDDGSTDRTPEILKEFAAKDSRIKAIYKTKNEGLAVSRNEALALATGKYIAFVDGDDLLDKDLFRKALECAEENNSDLVMWDYAVFSNPIELKKNIQNPSGLKQISAANKTALLQRPAFAWTKLIRTEKARELQLHFPKGLTRQDIPVHWKLITQLDNIYLIPERLSYYRQQPGATTNQKDKRLFDLATIMDIVKQQLVKDNLYSVYKDEFLRQQLGLLYGMVDHIDEKLKSKATLMLEERMGEEQWKYIIDKKPLRKQTRDFYLVLKGSKIARVRRFFWLQTRKFYRTVTR
jgi:glycosyltransferase involved in cell wall biosynthesis